MSAIAGVWFPEAARTAHEGTDVVQTMLHRMAVRGGDQRAVHTSGRVTLGADVRWTTPEDTLDRQPVRVSAPDRTLVLDGRLDNRTDIADRLGVSSALSDAALMLRWLAGPSGDPAALIGDFALAYWDADRQSLMLVRDALGMRPLYYAQQDGVFWFASALPAMLVPHWQTPEPNEGFVAEFLASAPASLDETAFRNIRRLPQAEWLELTPGGVRRQKYWMVEAPTESTRNDDDAIEAFRGLIDQSVAARLRTREPVAFQLSGGLDSSTVVGVARAQGVESPATYSLVFPEHPIADETEFIDAVVSAHGCRSVRRAVPTPPLLGFDVCDVASRVCDLSDGPTGAFMLKPLLRRAAADGHRVMLGGAGGDEWLTGSVFRTATLVRRGQVAAAWRFASEYRSIDWLDPGWPPILRTTAVSLLPDTLKVWLRTLRPRASVQPWITDDLARRVDLPARMRAPFERIPSTSDLVMRESLVRLTSGDGAFVREALDRMGAASGLELRHPFFDRRVVEFLIGIPDHLRFRDGTHRFLVRRACGDVLPDLIRSRRSKPDIDHVVVDTIRATDPSAWVRSAEVVKRGWVDGAVLQAMWDRAQQPPGMQSRSEAAGPLLLWQIVAVEAWLRAVFSTTDPCR